MAASGVTDSPPQKIVTVNGMAIGAVVVLWWALSLTVVRVLSTMPSLSPLLDATRHAIPAAREFARASGFADVSTLFYLFFVITTPFVAVFYFRFVHVRAALPLRVKLILWAALIVAAYLLSAGMDLGPSPVKGFKRTFNLLVTSSWFGSSFILLLACHCFLSCLVCVVRKTG